MIIKELNGLKRVGEFNGALQLQIPGNPDIWVGEDTLATALRYYFDEKCKPLSTQLLKTSVLSQS
jgi:hypothetical protein